jgi:hypothetical protein
MFGCQNNENELDKCLFGVRDHDEMITYTMSANCEMIRDSLFYLLESKEADSYSDSTYFRDFGEIYKDSVFSVRILLHDDNCDYTFIVRTFSNKYNIISSYDLAEWKYADTYCLGSIDDNLRILKKCKNQEKEQFVIILQNGVIEKGK